MTKIIFHMLEGNGWRVSATHHPRETLAALRLGDVDVLLADCYLPHGNSWHVPEILRQSHPTVPVILMSAFVDEIEPGHADNPGVVMILEKPFGPELLLHSLDRALSAASSQGGCVNSVQSARMPFCHHGR